MSSTCGLLVAFFSFLWVSFTNKIDSHYVTKIVLKANHISYLVFKHLHNYFFDQDEDLREMRTLWKRPENQAIYWKHPIKTFSTSTFTVFQNFPSAIELLCDNFLPYLYTRVFFIKNIEKRLCKCVAQMLSHLTL